MSKGVKQRDIQKCCGCGQGVLHDGRLTFSVVTLGRYVADVGAITRQHHLEGMLQPMPYLAGVMGPDEDLASELSPPQTIWLCDECGLKYSILHLIEICHENNED